MSSHARLWRNYYVISEFDKAVLVRNNCNKCINECYREPSLMQYIAISISDAFHHFRSGRLIKASHSLFNINNFISFKASLCEMFAGGRV